MTINMLPIASGGMIPGSREVTVQPTVTTRKNVPMNFVMY
jgi:hypothetical protein